MLILLKVYPLQYQLIKKLHPKIHDQLLELLQKYTTISGFLFARIGKPYSPVTGKEIKSMSVQEIIDDFFKLEKSFYYLLSPVVRNRKGEFKKELSDLIKKGYIRFRIDDEIYTSENLPNLKNFKHNIEVVVDRFQIQEKYKSRISQSIETALNLSDGVIYFYDVENSINHIFSSRFACLTGSLQ